MNSLRKTFFSPLLIALTLLLSVFFWPTPVHAEASPTAAESGVWGAMIFGAAKSIVPFKADSVENLRDWAQQDACNTQMSLFKYIGGGCKKGAEGEVINDGMLGTGQKVIASLYFQQPSSREYIADILDNVGLPQVNSAYAQGTGYRAMSPFLPFWKAFRNLAYSLYIIMFVVVGVMIMLRTKVNAQTVITIQSALPNLVITLILITFSYAIVGFMIDLMYFLIYFVVYLISAAGLISTPTKAISRLLGYSAWSVIFEGRNSIISAAALAISEVISGLGTGALEIAGTILSMVSPMYLFIAIWFAISMLKLMFVLIKSYVMLIVQTVTAPAQILLNAMPGSKAFSEWLKKTASYLIPFPVAAAMFIMAAVFVGDPTESTLMGDLWPGDANPFGINRNNEFYDAYYSGFLGDSQGGIWLPPFTLTGSVDITAPDIMILIGFFIFNMTPATVKMAQDWLQVKESPYTAEAFAGSGIAAKGVTMPVSWLWRTKKEEEMARMQAKYLGSQIKQIPWGQRQEPGEASNG